MILRILQCKEQGFDMSSEFVKTQVTLLKRIAVEKTGEVSVNWLEKL